MIDKFSDRFCHCNPKLGLDKGKDSMDIMIKWVFISYFVFFDLLWMKLVIDEGLILTPVRAGTHRVQIKSLVKGSEIHVSSFNVPYYGPIFFASFTSFHANIQYNYAKSCFSFILFLMFIWCCTSMNLFMICICSVVYRYIDIYVLTSHALCLSFTSFLCLFQIQCLFYASPWLCCPSTSAALQWKTKCPRESSSRIPAEQHGAWTMTWPVTFMTTYIWLVT